MMQLQKPCVAYGENTTEATCHKYMSQSRTSVIQYQISLPIMINFSPVRNNLTYKYKMILFITELSGNMQNFVHIFEINELYIYHKITLICLLN